MTVNLRERKEGYGSAALTRHAEEPYKFDENNYPGNGDDLDLRQLLASLDVEIAANRAAGESEDAGDENEGDEGGLASLIPPSSKEAEEQTRELARRLRDPATREATHIELMREREQTDAEGQRSMERFFDDCIARGVRPKTHIPELSRLFDEYVARKEKG